MNEHEHDPFEAELLQIRPASVPDDFAERLTASRPRVALRRSIQSTHASHPAQWWRWLRWFVPATASAAGLVILGTWLTAPGHHTPASSPTLRADDVEIDRQLIGIFEIVATLPNGEPVRIRCREWVDEVTLRDTVRGLAIEQRTPRLEIVPVSFETF